MYDSSRKIESALAQLDETGDPYGETGEADPRAFGLFLANHEEEAKELLAGIERAEQVNGGLNRRTLREIVTDHVQRWGKDRLEQYREEQKKLREQRERRREEVRRPEPVSAGYASTRDEVLRSFWHHNGKRELIRKPGYYYGVVEVPFSVEGTASGCVAYLDGTTSSNGVQFAALKEYVGQTSTRLGGSYVVTSADTNLSQPSSTSYVNELFLMKSVEATFRGFRIKYNAADYTGLSLGPYMTKVVSGNALTFDDDGIVIPKEVWNPLTDECELARSLATGAILQFAWNDEGAGNSSEQRSIEVCSFSDLPKLGRKSFAETSGAARTHEFEDGFWWCQDQTWETSRQNGGNGIFNAYVTVPGLVAFAFQPIHVAGSSTVLIPQGVALDWEICVYGEGFWPVNSERRRRGGR
jgi:hypothetical protein